MPSAPDWRSASAYTYVHVGESLRGSTFGAIPRTNEITMPLLTVSQPTSAF